MGGGGDGCVREGGWYGKYDLIERVGQVLCVWGLWVSLSSLLCLFIKSAVKIKKTSGVFLIHMH